MEVNKRILLIDDQEEILMSMKKLLNGEDSLRDLNNKMKSILDEFYQEENSKKEVYDVDIALNGKKGYEMVKEAMEEGEPYSVVTVDMRMPGWDGLKTAKEIRKIDSNIEIIIITAYTDIKREELVEEIGKPEKLLYLKKPFEREEILQVILSLTLKWSLEQKVKNQLMIIKNAKNSLEDVINGISEIEKSTPSSIKTVYKTILKELSILLKSKNAGIVFNDSLLKLNNNVNLGKYEDYKITKKEVDYNSYFVEKNNCLFVTFFCEMSNCNTNYNINSAIGVFEIGKGGKVDKQILDIFISHSNNLLRNASLYTQLEEKNRELMLSNRKLKEANALNKKFLVISSHELRTPGTIIAAYAELLATGKVKSVDRVAKGLSNAAMRLNILIEQMLEVFATSDMKAHLVVNKSQYDINEIFDAVYEKVGIFLEKRNQTLEFVNSSKYNKFYIDKNKVVEFIFFNLIMNAIKFSEDGSTIKVKIRDSHFQNKLQISIEDNGVGMTDYEKKNMFKALFVGGNENHHHSGLYEYKAKGLGLGLTIVKNIIDMIGEEIACESSLEKGTKITFTLPYKES